MRPTVLIVDDHAAFRASASALLAGGLGARANTRSEHLMRR